LNNVLHAGVAFIAVIVVQLVYNSVVTLANNFDSHYELYLWHNGTQLVPSSNADVAVNISADVIASVACMNIYIII
jgi:hypothetical protein